MPSWLRRAMFGPPAVGGGALATLRALAAACFAMQAGLLLIGLVAAGMSPGASSPRVALVVLATGACALALPLLLWTRARAAAGLALAAVLFAGWIWPEMAIPAVVGALLAWPVRTEDKPT